MMPDSRSSTAAYRLVLLASGGMIGALWPLHHGALPGSPDVRRMAAAMLVVLAYALFCVGVRLRRRAHAPAAFAGQTHPQDVAVLVVYASQTGFAEQLARQSAEMLVAGGATAALAPMAELTLERLTAARRVLFVVSTTGEGDAPDSAGRFARKTMSLHADLHGLEYGLMALGDSSYAQYNAFGLAVDRWLHGGGAQPMFDTVLVDNGDMDGVRRWQQYLGALGGDTAMADWSRPAYQRWTLVDRHCMNPGSPGAPAYHLALQPAHGEEVDWVAGDIAEVGPRHDPAHVAAWMARAGFAAGEQVDVDGERLALADALAARQLPDGDLAVHGRSAQRLIDDLPELPHREYSIASLPGDGSLQLLVRQTSLPGGRLGLGSGWLTAHAPQGANIDLRVRSNRGFHAVEADTPAIFIGNGTGLAGLRAHLKARAVLGRTRAWLMFGERTAAHDNFYGSEIEQWLQDGTLTRVDLAYSRDPGGCRYVQECVSAHADELRLWVAEGAVIYVCGSLQGMATGVNAALLAVLGEAELEALSESGRYRRDVY